MSISDAALNKEITNLAARLSKAATHPETIKDASLQQLMSAAVKLFAAKNPDARAMRVFPKGGGGVTATDVMITTTAMLQGVNVQMFELGMWQAWNGTHALSRRRKAG
jgi:hypothetical protein